MQVKKLARAGGRAFQPWAGKICVRDHQRVRTVAEDALVMISGEPLRLTFRRFMIQVMSEQQRRGLLGKDQLYTQHMDEILAFTKNVREDKAQEAMETYGKWPAELRKDKMLGLIAVMAAGKLGDDEAYVRQMAAYRTNFPNDPELRSGFSRF